MHGQRHALDHANGSAMAGSPVSLPILEECAHAILSMEQAGHLAQRASRADEGG
jgi:hypothetical protein